LPVNPYGASKLAIDQLLAGEYAETVDSIRLRYFNVGGAYKSTNGWLAENHSPETHLIPNVLSATLESPVKVFGTKWATRDGTCVRDFVHVVDLVQAHIKAMNALQPKRNIVINVGSGVGYSVAEVISSASEITGVQVPFVNVEPRPGDPSTLIADIKKAKELLNWTPTATLNQMILDAYFSRQGNNSR
jgi:UDP-glucose 4-epimerase